MATDNLSAKSDPSTGPVCPKCQSGENLVLVPENRTLTITCGTCGPVHVERSMRIEAERACEWLSANFCERHRNANLYSAGPCGMCRAEKAEEDIQNLGVIELAVRNTNVASYVEHWEKRALQAEAELTTLKASDGWVKCTDENKLPKLGETVLVVADGKTKVGHRREFYEHEDKKVWEWQVGRFTYIGEERNRVTHWRPLPAPPEGQKGGSK